MPSDCVRPRLTTIRRPGSDKDQVCYEAPYQNLYETLAQTSSRFPDKTAIVDSSGSFTWRELQIKVDRISAVMRERYHVQPGDRIGLFMMNSFQFCAVFYAILKLGAIAVVLNTKIAPPQLEWMLNDTSACMLFSDVDWEEKIRPVVTETQIKTVVFAGASTLAVRGVEVVELVTLTDIETEASYPAFRSIFAPAVIMYTSGTTVVPKGALISHFNILQNVLSYADMLHMDETECTVIGVPMFHITGLSCLMALFVYLGGKMVLVPKFQAALVNELMAKHHATHIHAVPSIYQMLYNAQDAARPLADLRSAVCGGGAIASATIRNYCRKNPSVAFHCAYGMTETAGAGVVFPVHYFDIKKEGASGVVMPNTEIHIIDETGCEVPAGIVGEICFSGSVVIDHYWKKAASVGFYNGWLASGDLGKFDSDGFIYIVDRKKDMINRSGEKIFSILVEKEIYNLPAVDLCAVFPVNDPVHGEVAAAAIVLHPEARLDPEQVRSYLLGRMAKYEVPQYIEIVDEIPLTPNNKISKYRLRAAFEEEYHLSRKDN